LPDQARRCDDNGSGGANFEGEDLAILLGPFGESGVVLLGTVQGLGANYSLEMRAFGWDLVQIADDW